MKAILKLLPLVILVNVIFLQSAWSGWQVTPRIRGAESWSDNVNASGSGDKDDDFITEINPGISVLKEEGRIQLNLDYEMQNVFYLNNSDSYTTFHNLDAVGFMEVMRNRFFIDMEASAEQAIIDPRRRISVDNISDTGNTTDVYRLALTPRWMQNFGRVARGVASYRVGITEYDEETGRGSNAGDTDDSLQTQATLSLTNFYPDDDISWGLRAQHSHVNYEDRDDITFEHAEVDLGYRVLYSLRLVGTYGVENNDFEEIDPTLDKDDDFWEAGFEYTPSRRNKLEVRYGDRFFGNNWFGQWRYRGRRLNLLARYKDDVTTRALDAALEGDLDFRIDDPTQVDTDVTNRETGVYEYKRYDLRAALTLSKSVFAVSFRDEDREYLTSFDEEESSRFSLTWDWQLGNVTQLTTGGFWRRYKTTLGEDDNQDTFDFRVEFNRELSSRTIFDARYVFTDSESDLDDNYTSNLIGAGITYEFK